MGVSCGNKQKIPPAPRPYPRGRADRETTDKAVLCFWFPAFGAAQRESGAQARADKPPRIFVENGFFSWNFGVLAALRVMAQKVGHDP